VSNNDDEEEEEEEEEKEKEKEEADTHIFCIPKGQKQTLGRRSFETRALETVQTAISHRPAQLFVLAT
jgi:hypothetical protein